MTEIIERNETPNEKKERLQWEANSFDLEKSRVNELRQSAYQLESDPIFFQAQRNDTYTLDDWKAKVAEIDLRYPYPEQPS